MRAALRRALGLLAALAVLGAGGGAAASAASAQPVWVGVDRAPVTAPLPQGFLGIALEVSTVPRWVGSATTPAQVNPVLVQLLRNLNPSGPYSIRIGGQSTDRSWWPVPNLTAPAGVTYAIGSSWAKAALLLAERLDARYVMGVNLEANSPRITQYEAGQLLAAIGRKYIRDFEIGNEPDLYTHTPWYRVQHGRRVPWYIRIGTPYYARPAGYNETDFLTEWQQTLAAMPSSVPIAGPDTASAQWIGPFSALMGKTHRIGMLDSHAYALFNCVTDPSNPKYPSIPHLLERAAATRIVRGASEFAPLAHHSGIPYRIDEMGSVSCDGHSGVSDAFASALWVTDALFEAARAGVTGVNLHSFPNSSNGLFDLADTRTGWVADVHPIYYGALMFAQADPAGARIIQIPSAYPSTLRIWATIGADHKVRVLIINVGSHQLVTIHAPKGFGSRDASVERLVAPSVSATSGETIGGQTLGNTTTGEVPTPTLQWARPQKTGYTVGSPGGSETLVTFSYRVKAATGK
ncbi:MAG TPA: glycosyl hydrolase family 79 C-terminal domain-containing protein [Solirubrobacteraceae bacterium]|nr:glycosyl hydrolase family 79 C-terminal domain-containing protein [Solirubrobacteraceae bacterium]